MCPNIQNNFKDLQSVTKFFILKTNRNIQLSGMAKMASSAK